MAAGWLVTVKPMSLIIGPVGSAKTTTAAMKAMLETCRQHPSTIDGVRRAHGCAVRQNYRQAHRSLIPSWKSFFGKDAKWTKWEKDGPAELFLRWSERGDVCEMTVEFASVGEQSVESFARGYEPTFFYTNEADELPAGALSLLAARCGRYRLAEKPKDVPPAEYCQVFGDMNMPDIDSWVHALMQNTDNYGAKVEVFLQPSGFDPRAENLDNLRLIDPNYYETKAAGYRAEGNHGAVARYIENKPGFTTHGKPVYPQFRSHLHIADAPMRPEKNRQLMIGVDQGGQAAAVITQFTSRGQLLVLAEVTLDPGEFYSGYQFGRLVAERLRSEFSDWCRAGGLKVRSDPAGLQRRSTGAAEAAREDDPASWFTDFEDGMAEVLRFRVTDFDVAETNALDARLGAVRKLLQRNTASGDPGLLVSSDCHRLARGFAGGYRFAPVQGRPGIYNPKPKKPDHHTDVHDALQYVALEAVPMVGVTERASAEVGQGRTAEPFDYGWMWAGKTDTVRVGQMEIER